ncbi:sulfotransferase [Candidatus Binatus sp.]|uniref:sulfotransferase n=1 Tax=Candidatus Binatus sp. TaxID=2811406 RepID=UPI003BB0976F
MTGLNTQSHEQASADTSASGVHLFVVIGAQRTGTNILREILNTNEQIAMLGEVLTPSPAPAHWDNFCRSLPARSVLPATFSETESLLDEYFEFVRYRIRNHWEGNKKSHSHAFGVDIKYSQLRDIAPANWNPSSPAFILGYLRSRGATIVHTTRNVIHCAISTFIATRRNVWHNYDGAVIDRSYHLDIQECLAYARTIVKHRDAFLEAASGFKVVNCFYESLIENIARAGSREEIPAAPGPLWDIAQALEAPFTFRYDRRLQKAINISYSRLLSNYNALVSQLKDSEFSNLVSTLE